MKYFTFKEMVDTDTKLKNIPTWDNINNMQLLITNILDPLRELYDKPIKINSGFRSPEVNKKVGGAKNSGHMLGTCADIDAGSKEENEKLFNLIKNNYMFRQLINEHDFSWVHVEYRFGDNKLDIIEIN